MSWTPGGERLPRRARRHRQRRDPRPIVRCRGRALEALLTLTPTAAIASDHDKIIVVGRRAEPDRRPQHRRRVLRRARRQRGAFSRHRRRDRSAAHEPRSDRAFEAEYTSRTRGGTAASSANVQLADRARARLSRHGRTGSRGAPRHPTTPAARRGGGRSSRRRPRLRGALAPACDRPRCAPSPRSSTARRASTPPTIRSRSALARLVRAATRSILIAEPLPRAVRGRRRARSPTPAIAASRSRSSPTAPCRATTRSARRSSSSNGRSCSRGCRGCGSSSRGEPSRCTASRRCSTAGSRSSAPTTSIPPAMRLNSEVWRRRGRDRFARRASRAGRAG